jgi:uncharacterized lipoprotein YehR (DUF1307 family)
MTFSKLILTLVAMIMGISLAACTASNSKPSSGPALSHDYADCTVLEELAPDKEAAATTAAIAEKAQRRTTSSSEPEQDLAGCITDK